MPELKNLFVQGKMNKDLDERLVPQGEYRDALNVDVSYSEGSDVGTLQNILGNGSALDSISLNFGRCIGSVRDTENNKIYWFIASPFPYNKSVIAEYDAVTGDVNPVIVDTNNNYLKFRITNIYQITGVNVLDGILYFTDNLNEPKQVDIAYWKSQTSDFNTTSTGLSEDRITVIKKSPFSAPTLTLKNTKRTVNSSAEVDSGTAGNTTITLTASTNLQFLLNVWSSVYVYGTGISEGATVVSITGTTLVVSSVSSTIAPSGTLTFATPIGPKKTRLNHRSLNFIDKNIFTIGDQPVEIGDTTSYNFGSSDPFANYNWQVGDQIKIYNNDYDAYAIEEVTSLLTNGFIGEIKALVGDFPDEELYWNAELIEEPILYESKFIRFAYRWKYEINGTTQYSLISPFSEVAFIPGNFKYNTLKGFNLAMENTLQKITISGFETAPSDVAKIEILLKYSDNTNIYKIKELSNSETSFSFEKEILGEVIPSNQLLRVYDSVPKKAKSQEIIANRLIYGNYTQNFDISSKPTFEINLINRSSTSNDNQSIKTIRNYQFGVVYFDEYNRQTPIFTDISGVFSVPIGGGNNLTSLYSSSQFKAKLTNTAPSWASKYKYYIKENANEYYNLALAGAHKTDNGFYYLAFPSSEVNKVQEGDYIIMKKSFNNAIVESLEKNKILSIETEAPDEIAKEKITELNINNVAFSPGLEDAQYLAIEQAGGSPTFNSNKFVLAGTRKTGGTLWDGDGTPSVTDYYGEGLSNEQITAIQASSYIRFSIANAKTKYYKISSTKEAEFLYHTGSGLKKHLEITLEEFFTDDVDFLYTYRGQDSNYAISLDDNVIKPNITISFYSENNISKKFDGQFFVKVQQNAVLNNYLQSSQKANIVDATKIYTTQLIANDTSHSGKWFIAAGGKSGAPDSSIPDDQGGATVYENITWQLSLITQGNSYNFGGNSYSFRDSLKIGAKVRFKDYQAVSSNFAKEQAFMGVNTITIQNGGTGYSSATNVTVSGGSGSGLTVNTTVTNNVVTSVTIGNNAGAGYKTGDIVTISGGNSDATLVLTAVEDEVYTITDMRFIDNQGSNPPVDIYHLNFDKYFVKDLPFDDTENHVNQGTSANYNLGDSIEIEILEDREEFDLTKEKKPPIFETYPEENELELFYETQEIFDISNDHGNFNNLKWFNCFTFNNGVESNRIRDDYNAIQIDKGAKVSTTFEEEYKEETVKTGLIFSGIYNRKNGVNRLNQFIIAEPITKELNPEYGSIQKLHTRDTDLIAFCEDKVLKVLANKDALFNADGNINVTSNTAVLGQAVPFAGEYGISKNPESFASHAYRVYFSDRARGKVLRLSLDGITEISNYGVKNYTKEKLAGISTSQKVIGSYDETKDQYNITYPDDTISFSESVKGWTSRKSFLPESGISLNNGYYTFYLGHIYKHNSSTRNTFYGTKTDSEVTLLLNGNPGNVKNFRTLNYQGDSGWIIKSALNSNSDYFGAVTNKQTGNISSFINKEDIYYNYISGATETTKADLDLKSLNIQGLGTPTAISNNDATFTDLNSAIQVGDKVYNNTDSGFKTVTAVSGNTITLDSAPTNDFSYFVKDNKFNTSGILGYYMQVTLTNTATTAKELYSVGSEVSLSS